MYPLESIVRDASSISSDLDLLGEYVQSQVLEKGTSEDVEFAGRSAQE